MLKQRIIATLVIKQDIVVQSIGFRKYLPVGKPRISVEALNDWGVDEIVILDIDASCENRIINLEMIRELSEFAFVPVCVGGGISNIDDIRNLLNNGADKVCLNQAFLKNKSLIKESSKIFGSQCIVISLDIKKQEDEYLVYDYISKKTSISMKEAILEAQKIGAGEILINSVDNDGMKCGYDLEMIKDACEISNIPVVAQGGANKFSDIENAIKIVELSGVAAANMFHYTEHSVTLAKSYLKREFNYPIRLETHMNYKEFDFCNDDRLLKKEDNLLESLVYKKYEKEEI